MKLFLWIETATSPLNRRLHLLDHGIQVYMVPIIWPKKKLAEHPLASKAADKHPVIAVVTNSTYDGVCYDAVHAEELLGQSVNAIHFDEV